MGSNNLNLVWADGIMDLFWERFEYFIKRKDTERFWQLGEIGKKSIDLPILTEYELHLLDKVKFPPEIYQKIKLYKKYLNAIYHNIESQNRDRDEYVAWVMLSELDKENLRKCLKNFKKKLELLFYESLYTKIRARMICVADYLYMNIPKPKWLNDLLLNLYINLVDKRYTTKQP